jgi:hypothetical protein
MTETNAERLENIHSKCLEQIEKYIDAKTKVASTMTSELDIVHEVGQAMKVLGEGVAANKTAIKGKEDHSLPASGSTR